MLPSLPVRMRQIMMVARVADAMPGERLNVGFGLATPRFGIQLGPQQPSTNVPVVVLIPRRQPAEFH